jgi:hypothetical protein
MRQTVKGVFLAGLVLQATTLNCAGALAQSASDLVGTWTLVSSVTEKKWI